MDPRGMVWLFIDKSEIAKAFFVSKKQLYPIRYL